MRSKFFVLVCILTPFGFIAQKFTSTPYSSYGIGVFGGLNHPNFSGIGNVSAPIIDSTKLNFFNPASYSMLGHGQPLFSTGVSTVISEFTEDNNTFNQSINGLNHLALAVPFGKRFAWAFGLKPYTRTGYEITDQETLGVDTIKYTYQGKGSTNQFFTGYSVKLLNRLNNKLSIGTHLSYIFGNSTHQQAASPTTGFSGGVQERIYQLKSLHYDFGLNYLNRMK